MAVRMGKYKLIWGVPKMMHRTYRGKEKDEDLESVIELYDLEKDPKEARNIALQNQ